MSGSFCRAKIHPRVRCFSGLGTPSYCVASGKHRARQTLYGEKLKAVLASSPGAIQAPLRAMLESFPEIDLSGSTSGGLSALIKVREEQPSLLVIDGSLSESEVTHLLREVRREDSQLRCIVLVDTAREGERLLSAGADIVLMRDNFSECLLEAMCEMGLVDPIYDARSDVSSIRNGNSRLGLSASDDTKKEVSRIAVHHSLPEK